MTLALDHSFLSGVSRRPPRDLLPALELVRHAGRLVERPLRVHPDLRTVDTGAGSFLSWAQRARGQADWTDLVTLLLRLTNGPWVADLEPEWAGPIAPDISTLPAWLQESLRRMLGTGRDTVLVSPPPTAATGVTRWVADDGARTLLRWADVAGVDQVPGVPPRSTLELLLQVAEELSGHVVVLESAIRSAKAWTLDCRPEMLQAALRGLPTYGNAMAQGLPRESCCDAYYEATSVPMSQETGDVWRRPNRRKERQFVAGEHGIQYFDVHAKPGDATRIHIWVSVDRASDPPVPVIFIGHCGRHLG